MNTDPIADLLTRIRNAMQAGHKYVELPASKMKLEIVKLLQAEGYIRNHEIKPTPGTQFKSVRITLKYDDKGYPVMRKLYRVSRPGLRKYSNVVNLPRVRGGSGIAIVTTSKGIMTDRAARREGIGGEILCIIE